MAMQAYEKEHLEALRPHLADCTVLLKKNGDFPLYEPGLLALYGSGVRHTVKGGTGSGEVNSRSFLTMEQALRLEGFSITTEAWLDGYDEVLRHAHQDFLSRLHERARRHHTLAVLESMGAVMPEPEYALPLDGQGDTAVYVLSRISGEGSDRQAIGGDILLSGPEIRDILALSQKYAKFMLVLNTGGPVDLKPVVDHVDNILLLGQLGVETGAVLADILLGRAVPSGKLTTTWAAHADWPTIGEFGDPDNTRYREGVYVGYRYYDSVQVQPLFPFGYGLGYTDFAQGDPYVSHDGERVYVSVPIRNVGTFAGRETLQVYVSSPEGVLDQPYQALAAFAKTRMLQPGEEETLRAEFLLSSLASFDTERSAYILEAGRYILHLGVSSRDTRPCAVFQLPETVIVRKVRHAFAAPGFMDWRPEERRDPEKGLPDRIPVYTIDPQAIASETPDYNRAELLDPRVEALSDEKLCYLSIGAFREKGGVLGIIGNAGITVAGAAGETTRALLDMGIPSLVMADGPAGLRLARDYVRDEDGVHALGSAIPESILELLSPWQQRALSLLTYKAPKDAEIQHQYATAIPIGTAIAQSWDTEFAKLCGDIVGREMERFGVHLWLAPALNIHRDVRCGRNFEYFSEDPLLSGVFASAITQGVQAHPGCGTTIKHFAANNQETNRYNSNSRLSERALREIYLKGFEICVRQSQPAAVMTSYNLINSVHTSERRDLTEDILRGEWGFDGIVMTDWVIAGTTSKKSAYPAPQAYRVAAAGGNLFMPGTKKDYLNVLDALRMGKLKREQLVCNASRLTRLMGRLGIEQEA